MAAEVEKMLRRCGYAIAVLSSKLLAWMGLSRLSPAYAVLAYDLRLMRSQPSFQRLNSHSWFNLRRTHT